MPRWLGGVLVEWLGQWLLCSVDVLVVSVLLLGFPLCCIDGMEKKVNI